MAALEQSEQVPITLDLKPSVSSPTKRVATCSALRTSTLVTQHVLPEVLMKVAMVVLLVVLFLWQRRWTSATVWQTGNMVTLLVQNSMTISVRSLLFWSLLVTKKNWRCAGSIGHAQ